jgi:membrane-associated PAP2 superfamily phosphatase
MSEDASNRSGAGTPSASRVRWPLGPIRTLLVVTVALSVLFLAFPRLDLWFSGLFYDTATGFAASDVDVLSWLRRFSRTLILAVSIALIVSVLAKLILPNWRSLIPPRTSLFLGSTLIVGPGILVNGILKANWGRPRPIAVEEFGGDLPYIEVWRITDYCERNCSFVSGEASAAIWLLALALVVPIAWRNRVAAGALVLATILSLNRVAFGGHFISDVLLSWTLTLTIIAVAHHYLFVRPLPGFSGAELEGALTRAGRVLRNAVGLGSKET